MIVPHLQGILEFPCDVERLPNGNTLITDAGDETCVGSEVIEVDPRGQIVWRYDQGLNFAHSAKRLDNGNTLITDTLNDRVIEVSPEGRIVWSSAMLGGGSGKLSDGTRLCYPNDAHELPDGTLLVTDRNNNRCVIFDRQGKVVWQYSGELKHPHNADLLPNGHVLVVNSDTNVVLEVNRAGEVVWRYDHCSGEGLSFPRDADRLENGNTLITDSRHHRVIEVTPHGREVWRFGVDYYASFYEADRLPNGNTLISDQHHHRILEVDPFGNIVWQFRNRRFFRPVHPRLINGSFKQRDADGSPSHWLLFNRFAEGGGRLIWDETAQPRPCPGLEFDRSGALCLVQYVGVIPGVQYTLAGQIRTEGVAEGKMACFQLFFLDEYGGPCENTAQAPKGQAFTGTTDWTQDQVQAVAPARARSVEVRLFINGPGKAWMKGLMLFS